MKQTQLLVYRRSNSAPQPKLPRCNALLSGLLALPLMGIFVLPSLAQTPSAPGISGDPNGPKSQIPPAIAGGTSAPSTPLRPNGAVPPSGAGTPGGPGLPSSANGPLSPNPPEVTEASGTPVAPQNEIELLRAQLAAQQVITQQLLTRLDALEAGRPVAPATPVVVPNAPVPITGRFPIAFSGTFFQRFDSYSDQSGPGAELFNTFRTRRAQIGLNATITPRVSSFLLVNFGKLSQNVPIVNAPLQTLSLSYKLSAVKPRSPLNSSLFFDIGAFKIPLGYEGDIPDGNTQFVERSLLYRARDRFGGGSSEVSDTGAQLRGKFGGNKFDYRLGIFNGLGDRSNLAATGDPKAFVGRLTYLTNPTGEGLQVGVSTAFAGDQNVAVNTMGLTGKGKRELYNAFAVYKKGKFAGSAEILGGRSGLAGLNNSAVLLPAEQVRKVLGYYVGGGYAISPKFELITRYDSFDFARDYTPASGLARDTTVHEYTVGLNYFIKGLNAKIATNFVRVEGGDGLLGSAFPGTTNATSFENTRNEFRTQFQVAF